MAIQVVESHAEKNDNGYYEGHAVIIDTVTGETYTGSCDDADGPPLHKTREAAIACAIRQAKRKRDDG